MTSKVARDTVTIPTSSSLPPGQRPAPLRRFGLPQFATVTPVPATEPVVAVGGTVRRPTQVTVAQFMRLVPRQEMRRDLHCVTTWTATGLRWSGVPFTAVHAFLADLVRPHRDAGWITFTGLDGYRACLRLADALTAEVMLADMLDGQPLAVGNGAPVRLVAPDLYGYKSVRHVCAIDYRLRYDPGSAGWLAHPRARVEQEERSRLLPGPVWRPIWRWVQPKVRRVYAHRGWPS
jgi:DMSO/TMAO reductase YedYZ molybdopterin-dependent catalytic subunit